MSRRNPDDEKGNFLMKPALKKSLMTGALGFAALRPWRLASLRQLRGSFLGRL
jgi:hypothetical protein